MSGTEKFRGLAMSFQKILQFLIICSMLLSVIPVSAAAELSGDDVSSVSGTFFNDPASSDVAGIISVSSGDDASSAPASSLSPEDSPDVSDDLPASADGDRRKIIFIHGGRSEDTIYLPEVAADPMISQYADLVVMTGGSVSGTMDEILAYDFSDADVVIFHNLASELVGLVLEKSDFTVPHDKVIITTAGNWTEDGYIVDKTFNEYLDFRIRDNYYNAVLYIGKKYAGIDAFEPGALKTKPAYGIYHPDAGNDRDGDCYFSSAEEYMEWYRTTPVYDENKPMIAIILDSFKSLDKEDNSRDGPMVCGMIRAVENKGANVLFATYAKADPDNLKYLTIDGEPVPQVILVTARGGRLPTNESIGVDGVTDLKELNVVAMHAVRIFGNTTTPEAWNASMEGVPDNEIPYIVMGEMDGLIEPVVVLVKEYSPELNMNRSVVLEKQMDWFVDRAMSWSALNTTPNDEKVVVIPYYAAEAGKANIGADTDYYLNAPASLINLLENMSDEGYDLGSFESEIMSQEDPAGALSDLMVTYGHNTGTWAPGMVDQAVAEGRAVLVPEEEYRAWFEETLSKEKQKEVRSLWGDAPGDIMVFTDNNTLDRYIVIPTIRFGNVILTPNPMRGRDQSSEALANKGAYPPTHQCLAFYYWFNNVENDNKGVSAYLPFYSNIAVMPGHETTLAADDWGAILMQDKPIIHILPVDAKGTTDARRGNMQVISYLTPALVPAGLSRSLSELNDSVSEFLAASDDGKESLRPGLISLIEKNGIGTALNVTDPASLSDDEFLDFAEDVSGYLEGISGALIPLGTHTLGETPDEADMRLMAEQMYRTDSSRSVEEYMNVMNESAGREIPAILNALSAGYTPANLAGDPVKKPDVLPAGGGLYNHDTRTIPTKESWNEGVRLVDELIAAYQKEHGADAYPDKTAYLLWAIETSRNGGVLESQILYSVGVKPVWNSSNGRLMGFYDMNSGKVVSGSVGATNGIADAYDAAKDNLARPRLDVLVVTSGSYRDMYGGMLQNITTAISYAAKAEDENDYENYVRRNTEKILEELKESGNYTDEEAEALSQARIFAPAPGEYTSGIENMVAGSYTSDDLAQMYIDRMGYIYSGDLQGAYDPDVFAANLADVDRSVFSRSSSLYGVLDHDMVASYFGGLSAAVDKANGDGPAPDSYIMNMRQDGKVRTLGSFLHEDLRSRYLNENWVDAMMADDYAGTTFMNEFSEALRLWDSTTDGVVTTETWQAVYDMYVSDGPVKDYLKETNAYAYQSLVGNLLQSETAVSLPEDVRNDLIREFVQSTAQSGVTCCHHTCGNPSFTDFIVGQMSAAGVDPADQEAFMTNIREAGLTFTEPEKKPSKSSSSGRGAGKATVISGTASLPDTADDNTESSRDDITDSTQNVPARDDDPGEGYGNEPGNAGSVSGYRMDETKQKTPTDSVRDFLSNPVFSTSNIVVILVILLLIGIIFYGYRKKGL